jgi:pyruvate/2-oxoglutarate dehydrogenase complex dihydrolipoamide acyltransferase (E2) component
MNQDPLFPCTIPIVLPDLGTGGTPVRFVLWLVAEQAHVIPGERIAEVLAEGTLFQIDAEVEGDVLQLSAQPGLLYQPGETLGLITPTSSQT